MNKEMREKVRELKGLFETKVKETIDHIHDQYTDSSPVFLKEGEVGEVDHEQLAAKNKHLAFLRTVENEISNFFLMVDETIEKVQFPNEKEWFANVEKEAGKLMEKLNGLR
ncbi:MAG: hypothetical protein DYG99_12160 [Bacteroidetes bacterium CHB5]|nr:hypothetical protein [Bacteroidetes bacterium CHB5]